MKRVISLSPLKPNSFIEEDNPLKQGLKPFALKASNVALKIEEDNPLKQGLKPKIPQEQIDSIYN